VQELHRLWSDSVKPILHACSEEFGWWRRGGDDFPNALTMSPAVAGGAVFSGGGAKQGSKALKDTANDPCGTHSRMRSRVLCHRCAEPPAKCQEDSHKITDKLLIAHFDTPWGGASSGGGILGGIVGLAKSIFGGFRADGGSVSGRKGYHRRGRRPRVVFSPYVSATDRAQRCDGAAQGLKR